MTKGQLVIFRHGETEYNKNHLMTGQREVPLTAKGEDQARDAGKCLGSIKFDSAFSSTLSRAFNTAALALESSAANEHLRNADGTWNIVQDKDIIEGDTGIYTGRDHHNDPEILAFGQDRVYDRAFPGGESDKQLVERVRRFFDDNVMPRLLKGENVMVVCHAGIVRAFNIVLGLEAEPGPGQARPKVPVHNASPTLYEYEDGKMTGYQQLSGAVPPSAKGPGPAAPI
jgi:broad specificity phosphatase PhoE